MNLKGTLECASLRLVIASVIALLIILVSVPVLAAQIIDVTVRGQSDRDLVIIHTDQENVEPSLVLQKLLPTRIEAVFNEFDAADIDLTGIKSGLVKRVSVIEREGSVAVVIQLDHQGKANPEMFRWSNPRPNICVLEVFHPTSDRSPLSEATFAAGSVGEPILKMDGVPEVEVSILPELAEPTVWMEGVEFDKQINTIHLYLSEGAEPEMRRGVFPPSLSIEIADAGIVSGVPNFITKYYGRILHITTRAIERADGSPESAEVLVVFTNGPEVQYSVDSLDGGKTISIQFSNIIEPEPLIEPEVVVTENVQPEAVEIEISEPEAAFEEEVEVVELPAPELPGTEPEPLIEPEVVVTENVQPEAVETEISEPEAAFEEEVEVIEFPAPELSGTEPEPVEIPEEIVVRGVVTSVAYDPELRTLTITTDEPSKVTVSRDNFPPGYTAVVDLGLSQDFPETIAKFLLGMRLISASEYWDGEDLHTRVRIQFENNADWTLISAEDSLERMTHTLSFGPAETRAEPIIEEAAVSEVPADEETYELPEELDVSISPASESMIEDARFSVPSVDEIMRGESAYAGDNETVPGDEYDDFPDYPLDQFTGRADQYTLPEFPGAKERLSDVLVTLPTGLSIYAALEIMSFVSGISIILDPYWNQEPTGSGPNNRQPLDTLGPGQGFGGGGFREAGEFNAIRFQEGQAVQGNFTDVPFDTALTILLSSNNLKMKVYRDESDPYSKPIIFVTSRERIEHELKDANEVEIYQLHYADPFQITQILLTLDILSSVNVGYYIYQGNLGFGGGGGGGGFGGGGQGGFGGGGQGGQGGRGGRGGRGGYGYGTAGAPYGDSAVQSYFGSPTQIGPGGGGGGFGGGGGGGQQGGGGGQQGGQGGGLGGAIPLPTAKSGLMILRGTRDTLETAKDIIRKVDKPPKQASLKVTIYTVSENPQKVYGLLSATANMNRTFFDYSGGAFSLIIPPRGGIIPADNYTAAFDSLQTERKAKVINQTEIAVIDGLPANIEFSRTRGNFRTVVTFDANGNAFRTGTYDEVTADTSLFFLPQIDDYGRITLQFSPDVTVFDGPPQVADDGQGGQVTFQPTTTTTLDTVLRLQDGETALIGGLMIETDSDDIFKVPFIGDLPFIGSIFTHHTKSRETSYIFVTITATIIDDK